MRLAAAYDAEIETIVVDQAPDEDVDLPVRRIGRAATADILEPSVTERRFELLAQRCRRAVESASAARKVKVRHALAHGDAVDRISEMCLARGPWNIVALVRMPALGGHSVIGSLLANVSGATGFLLCSERTVDANAPGMSASSSSSRTAIACLPCCAPPNGFRRRVARFIS